jgi:hypothetical protein
MEGEIWKPIPDFEEYYMVSNLGRVKALSRWVYCKNGRKRFIEEHIKKQILYTYLCNNRTVSALRFNIRIEKRAYGMTTARVVYSAFIKKIPPKREELLCVLHHDLDSLNNHIENLYLVTQSESIKHNYKLGYMPEHTPERRRNLTIKRGKPISQYSRSGKFICTYPSVREATRITGIDEKTIAYVATERMCHAGGFIWRYDTDAQNLDDTILARYVRPINAPVLQYDLENHIVATYRNAKEAAELQQLNYPRLQYLLNKGNGMARYKKFIWKRENSIRTVF